MDELKPGELVNVLGERVDMPVVRQVGDTVTCLRLQKNRSHKEVDYPRATLVRAPKPEGPFVITSRAR